MAILSNADRTAVWAETMKKNTQEFSLTKQNLRAAVDAADQWVEDNKAAFNSALPGVAQAALTVSQKAQLLTFVATKRFIVGA